MRFVIQLVLWVVIAGLAYLTFNSIYEPIQFNKVKKARYAEVIERLKDIRSSQLAHKEVSGVFANDFNSLIKFIDTAQFTITQRRDTTVLDEEMTKRYGVDQYKSEIIIDTLGYVPVKDSLFKNSSRYKELMFVPTTDKQEKFEIKAGTIKKKDINIPVFEVKVRKEVLLEDQDRELVIQENQVQSVEGVNGAYIKVGSMEEVNTSGNWPKIYGANDE
ncbi:hypothetical protein [Mesonia sp. K7]|uniref:hypothetical protein n=1 Tax=Mesonia sp. K7 TaxID=2218606 RepID=UPI000DA906FF|nr:hypothetical protein [Mesonia sp. K7]PZD79228.1 hypothetical protein DNG35_01700 [Mesonia sp. K7]